MEAQDLRVNNYYNSVKWNQPVRCELSDFRELYIRCEGAEIDSEIIAEYFEPILLTEEWLLKFGFEKDEDHIWIFPTNTSLRLWGFAWNVQQFSFNVKGVGWDEIITPSIKHIHQLQNLHYALTNKELTIKES
jgi:hypothetical protein